MLFQRRHRRRWSEQKRTRKVRLLPKLLIILGLLVCLELLTRLIVNTANLNAQLAFDQSPAIIQAYGLNFATPNGQPYEKLPAQGQLTASPDPLMGYHLLPTQQSEFWNINAQGFRDQDPVPHEKPVNEVRITVLGGSTAFGQLSSSNDDTFSEQLETQLNNQVAQQKASPEQFQPVTLPFRADHVETALSLPPRIREEQYRVINAAVPGYASGNELARLVQQVADYNPDIVVVLDSFTDLMLPSDKNGVGVPGIESVLQNKTVSPLRQATQRIRQWFSHLTTVKVFRYYGLGERSLERQLTTPLNFVTEEHNTPLSATLPVSSDELNRRVQRYQQNLIQMVRWASGSRKQLVIGLQPEITGRSIDVITPEESKILEGLGSSYSESVQAGYAKLERVSKQVANNAPNTTLLNYYRLYANFDGQAFQSPTSLTDGANSFLADQFYQAIAADLVLPPKPYGS